MAYLFPINCAFSVADFRLQTLSQIALVESLIISSNNANNVHLILASRHQSLF